MDADVIVVGAGNAGMCAAHAARERGARVLVLEKAPPAWAGGNSAFTAGAMRFAHGGLDDVRDLVEPDERETVLAPYPAEEFLADMARVTLGRGDPAMARVLVGDSAATLRWMHDPGIRFRLMHERQADEGADGRWTFWGGLAVGVVDGGRGLIDQHAAAAERRGIEVRHECAVEALERGAVTVRRPDGRREALRARAIVLAAGGFESNPQLRAAYLGPNWDVAKVRGTPDNTGEVLRAALAAGAQPYGHWSGCHAIQWDRDAPPTGDLELTTASRASPIPSTPTASASSTRARTSATTRTPRTAPRSWTSRSASPTGCSTRSPCRSCAGSATRRAGPPGVDAPTLRELADGLGIDRERFERTVADFNAAIAPGAFDPAVKDGLRTHGLAVEKTNWALAIDTPPCVAFPVTCGITFTFGGLFLHNYPGGSGLTAGAVYGRRAGYAAAALALSA